MAASPRSASFLRLAEEELGAARRLAPDFPRQAAYQLQQATEKIARAVLDHEGIAFGVGHNLGQMAAALPVDHAWRGRLMAFDRLSPAATRWRYPAPGGRLAPPPALDRLLADAEDIESALAAARDWLGPN